MRKHTVVFTPASAFFFSWCVHFSEHLSLARLIRRVTLWRYELLLGRQICVTCWCQVLHRSHRLTRSSRFYGILSSSLMHRLHQLIGDFAITLYGGVSCLWSGSCINKQKQKQTRRHDCFAFIGGLECSKCGDTRQEAGAVRIFLVALSHMSCRGRVQQFNGRHTIDQFAMELSWMLLPLWPKSAPSEREAATNTTHLAGA